MRQTIRTIAAVGAAVLLAGSAQADWLMLRNGSRVETRGPWQVKGKLVVFTYPNGSLTSLRAEEVDLDASSRATTQAQAPAATAPAEKPKAVVVLTDADVEHVSDAGGEPSTAEPAGRPAPAADQAASDDGKIRVAQWEQGNLAEGIEIKGTVRNDSRDVATSVTLAVILYDENGKQIGRSPAILTATDLPPAQLADFQASFPTVSKFASVKFEAQGLFLKAAPTSPDANPNARPADVPPPPAETVPDDGGAPPGG